MSPFSAEHYKAIVEVSKNLTDIINRPNTSASVRTQCSDSLARLCDMLGVIECSHSLKDDPII
jgi:hypothetical protein